MINETVKELKERREKSKNVVRETNTKVDTTMENLSDKIDATEIGLKEDITELKQRIDLIDQNFMIMNNDLKTAQAEIKGLQRDKLKETIAELKQDISKVDKKVDLVNRKFPIITGDLLTIQTEIKELQSINNLL